MITRDKMNVVAQKFEPDPHYVDYWIDLEMDATGNVIKSFSDGRWMPLNYKADIDLWHHILELVDALGFERTEDDKIVLPENDNVYFTGDTITELLANGDALLNTVTENLEDLGDDLEQFKALKGQPNGLAELDENGTVPREQLPSYVDDVIDVYATFHVGPTGILSDIHLYEDKDHTKEIKEGEPDKIYVNITGLDDPGFDDALAGDAKYKAIPYLFRWSGTQFVHIDSNVLILGDITDTAFDGGKGKKLEDAVNSITELVAHITETPVTHDDSVDIKFKLGAKGNDNIFTYEDKKIPLALATHEHAGLLSKTDKIHLDTAATIPDTIISEGVIELEDRDTVLLHLTQYLKNESGVYVDDLKANLVIKAASDLHAGVMTTEMYKELHTNLPGRITAEENTRLQKYEELHQKGEAFEASAKLYKTTNDKAIADLRESLKKLADGAGLQENDYAVPDTTDENLNYISEADSIFGAVEKLDIVLHALYEYLKLDVTTAEDGKVTVSSTESKPQIQPLSQPEQQSQPQASSYVMNDDTPKFNSILTPT